MDRIPSTPPQFEGLWKKSNEGSWRMVVSKDRKLKPYVETRGCEPVMVPKNTIREIPEDEFVMYCALKKQREAEKMLGEVSKMMASSYTKSSDMNAKAQKVLDHAEEMKKQVSKSLRISDNMKRQARKMKAHVYNELEETKAKLRNAHEIILAQQDVNDAAANVISCRADPETRVTSMSCTSTM